jgi:hypothetical protein
MPDGPGLVDSPSLSQMTAAMGVSPAVRAALKVVEKMEALVELARVSGYT